MADTSHFFDALRDHSEIKLRILDKFILPWRAKLGYKVRRTGRSRLWYVDGFAGPGKYEDGREGSPVIGARHALSSLREDRGYVFGCVNVELKRQRYEALEVETEQYRHAGVLIHNLNGDFSELVPEILRVVGQDDPALLFIDPFGISPLKLDRLCMLVSRPGETDLVLTLNTRSLDRLRAVTPHLISAALGTDRWMNPDEDLLSEVFGQLLWRETWKPGMDPVQQMRWRDVILYLLKENLKREGRFLDVVDYPIRAKATQAPNYHLLFASRHYDAYELLNDEVCSEEEVLSEATFAQVASGQSSFIHAARQQQRVANLIMAIGSFSRSTTVTCRRDLRQHLVMNHWGHWHTKEIHLALKSLADLGKATRHEDGRGIDKDRFTLTF